MSQGPETPCPARFVLEGVPRVRFYAGGPRCPEDIPFPAVMTALTEYLGEDGLGCRACQTLPPGARVTCTYAFFVGITGIAAFLSWRPGWEGDNVEIMYMSDDPRAPFERAFRAAGYGLELHGTGSGAGRDTEEDCRRAILDSLCRGRRGSYPRTAVRSRRRRARPGVEVPVDFALLAGSVAVALLVAALMQIMSVRRSLALGPLEVLRND